MKLLVEKLCNAAFFDRRAACELRVPLQAQQKSDIEMPACAMALNGVPASVATNPIPWLTLLLISSVGDWMRAALAGDSCISASFMACDRATQG
ncbi:hypothetical protein [Noviherbaspirillum denitrificans]|uniref:Uncharacterized protein n=1 Tax=Noviherbaspirillum denitrificans TaxID=1968433 RepID=A0A254TCK2_9BURK|nr:hypothetical protein [Noviherbaspirillum denitrificans]OWW18293.1 hypothetical protein AYR66_02215 [Noviherbaspirillum denitrificans]